MYVSINDEIAKIINIKIDMIINLKSSYLMFLLSCITIFLHNFIPSTVKKIIAGIVIILVNSSSEIEIKLPFKLPNAIIIDDKVYPSLNP